MKLIGVTGPSGSGKTLLTKYFTERGVAVIDADEVYHSLLVPPSECLDALRDKFGNGIFAPDGTLERSRLADIVFSDKEKLKLLNSTVLGIVVKAIDKMIAALKRNGAEIVILDAPTLIEAGIDKRCDKVVSVIAPLERRIERIRDRDGLTLDQAMQRVKAQKPDEFYIEASDIVMNNDSGEQEYEDKIRKLAISLGVNTDI